MMIMKIDVIDLKRSIVIDIQKLNFMNDDKFMTFHSQASDTIHSNFVTMSALRYCVPCRLPLFVSKSFPFSHKLFLTNVETLETVSHRCLIFAVISLGLKIHVHRMTTIKGIKHSNTQYIK